MPPEHTREKYMEDVSKARVEQEKETAHQRELKEIYMKMDLQRSQINSSQSDINELEKYLEKVKKEAQSDEKNRIIKQLSSENTQLKEENQKVKYVIAQLEFEVSNRKDDDFVRITQLTEDLRISTEQN